LLLAGASANLVLGLLAVPFGSVRQRAVVASIALFAVGITTVSLAPH
jgi:hypothetical protein